MSVLVFARFSFVAFLFFLLLSFAFCVYVCECVCWLQLTNAFANDRVAASTAAVAKPRVSEPGGGVRVSLPLWSSEKIAECNE